jgi:hypothetical protein
VRVTGAQAHPDGAEARLAIRPEKVRIGGEIGPQQTVRASANLEQFAFYGDFSRFILRLASGTPITGYVYYRSVAYEGDPAIGAPLEIGFAPNDALLLPECGPLRSFYAIKGHYPALCVDQTGILPVFRAVLGSQGS